MPRGIYIAHEHWLVCEVARAVAPQPRSLRTGRQCVRCVLAHRNARRNCGATPARSMTRALASVDAFVARSELQPRVSTNCFGFPRDDGRRALRRADAGQAPFDGPSAASRGRTCFFAGRLEPIKGVERSHRRLRPASTGPDLVIAGAKARSTRTPCGPAPPATRACISSDACRSDRLAPYYRHALASLVPSKGYETFGMVVIESLAQGTPVVARRHRAAARDRRDDRLAAARLRHVRGTAGAASTTYAARSGRRARPAASAGRTGGAGALQSRHASPRNSWRIIEREAGAGSAARSRSD